MNIPPQTIHIIAGPTAGGKSAKALKMAAETGGVVINCDSIQLYEGLPLLTAQPSKKDMKDVPHRLYACLHPNKICSAGNWRELVIPVIEDVLAAGQTPIVVGGTGLYIKALMEGLSPVPDIPPDIRAAAVEKQKKLGNPGFYEALKKRDPVMAGRFHPGHTARLVRAWEVLEATGKSLADWQKMPREGPPEHWQFEVHKVMPARAELRGRCDERFLQMIERGALEEVERFAARVESGEVEPTVPLTKALGFSVLLSYAKSKGSEQGENQAGLSTGGPLTGILEKEPPVTSLDEAIARAQAATRQYAKRQTTWFRNQL